MALEDTWPEWSMITTEWDGPYDEPDPDQYTATCLRCQAATPPRTPFTFGGTRVECVAWLQPHFDDPEAG